MEAIQLNQWKVMGTLPYQADFSAHITDGVLLPNLTQWIDAEVPGSIYRDLLKAGYIEEPYFDQNSLHCEWVAGRWWIYRTTFTVSKEQAKKILKLRFGGIDYSAQIYVNGKKVGRHEGMYIPFEAIINPYVSTDEENVLVCVLEHAPLADPQPGYTSKTRYLKARFNYKWDFAARVMDLGLYEPVEIHAYDAAAILHSFARPVLENGEWKLFCEVEIEAYRDAEAVLSFDLALHTASGTVPVHIEKSISLKKGFQHDEETILLDDAAPLLWWPNGYGPQILHPLTITLSVNGTADDAVEHTVGFRTIEYRHADGREDALPYNVVINGKRIYLKGTNMVPLDCIHCTDEAVIRERLTAVHDANVNFLRIWGGGHLESETYYHICDELGLMILQEFTMSSSGCDDVPSRNPEFLKLLHEAAVYTIKQRRNHVSLILIDGGNELTDWRYMDREDHEGHPATFADPTLAMLKGIVNSFAPDIQMLPSSATGPNALLKVGDIGNNHDVHGPWGYVGPYRHYEFYDSSDSIVHGEFGCGGISGMRQLTKIFRPEDLHLDTAYRNRAWAHHSGGWDNYNTRERLMFGDLYDIPLADYVKVNQFVQAESLRYSLEANRRRQWKNVGEMTWQFNEPWPNAQCSNVLEYYGDKKLAYYFLRDAYASVLTSLKYKKLFYEAGETFEAELWLINDRADADFTVEYEVVTESGDVLTSGMMTGTAKEDLSFKAGAFSAVLPDNLTGGFSVCLHTVCGDFEDTKEYLFLIADQEIPVELTDEDRLMLHAFKRRWLSNEQDAKRADIRPVLRYVDRMWEKYDPAMK